MRIDAEQLFVRYFLPLYPPDARDGAALARARAEDANPGRNPSILAHLAGAADQFVENAGALFDEDLRLDRTDASVHRLGLALTRERRDAWAARGAEGTADNVLFNAVVHGAAYVGACVVASHGAAWGVRRPLWESVVRLRSRAGEGDLAVFHWWLKSLADDALAGAPEERAAATLADRYRTHVEVPCAKPEELPVLVAGARTLPRLKQPRYDLLYKYLRAHLPELRDLGADFPTPERFEAYDFRWMDFHVLGGGRMLLLAGASPHGLHLFWLSAAGFEKSAFLECDAFPDPLVRVEEDRLVTMTSESGKARVHEMLWWGP
ncbi:MAG TPA: hypothetical protein VGL81_05160 [Polyangiaceae bacterium]